MDIREILLDYLRSTREGLLWKAAGLSERELRLPRTPTGTNLLGLIKHCAGVEHGYLVDCFGRTSTVTLTMPDFDADPNADLYAGPDESAADLIDLYRRVGDAVEESVRSMDLTTPGHVPWWGERGATTLGRVLVHVLVDVSRHAGQADILREGIDGVAGLAPGNGNLWEPADGWEAHVARLTALADGT